MSNDETTSQAKDDKREMMGIPSMDTLVKTLLDGDHTGGSIGRSEKPA